MPSDTIQSARRVIAQHPAKRDDIGDLVTRRPLPGPQLEQLDPFLFLNHHGPQTYPANNRGLPFGPHPHRGFETVTFILEGSLAHADSAKHQSVINAGGVQWMTAGSGIVHAEISPEEFLRDGGPLEILQLWINLPSRLKMSAPRYVGLQQESIPAIKLPGGGELNLISGEWQGSAGPIDTLTGVFMSTLRLPAGSHEQLPVAPGRQVFLYVVDGDVTVGGEPVKPHHLIEVDRDGDNLDIEASSDARLLFGHGEVIDEPVYSHGPFVMNTREEIVQAVEDYQNGKFGGLDA
ncbi:pirin family protein [Vreelandella titanicae]|jgi:redox-sensitive bicupin YhaK (pirin superfamily)|uniref:Pirin n=1 Tax=Vreelandella titanicae BH1 TaxID=1204738 RepID=L9UDS8_9GAMM|nr:pirin family protein [Halomonas titanicae]ELY22867.1 Pirin [Halomonas titanicae BH1]MCE7517889.1 pirin family protein [Halomonas titanicae]NVE89234.1 pirin family protein [Halomonas titanicae]QNU63682.1 pirin family protein [Halomonas titanicae]|tara:strand:+ start:141 stop:1016 length:876 start_codon:yes stop_codon:yes gene_type:complete